MTASGSGSLTRFISTSGTMAVAAAAAATGGTKGAPEASGSGPGSGRLSLEGTKFSSPG